MRIILLSGKMGAGKTTIQNALVQEWHDEKYRGQGHRAYIVNFADVLYEMHNHVLGILHRYWPDRGLVKDGNLLQLLGTEWARNTIDQDIWVKILRKKIEHQNDLNSHKSPLFIIGDARFENEFDSFPDAFRVRVHAPESVRRERCSMWRDKTDHPSETGLDTYAVDGRFDLIVDSHHLSPQECVQAIMGTMKAKELLSESR